MRKSLFALVLAAAIGAPGAVSLATTSFRQSATVAFTDHHAGAARAGASVGLSVTIVSTDAGVMGGKPKAAQRVAMVLPSGTRINLRSSVARPCRLTDAQITKPFGPRCPAASEIGHGTALINTNPMGVALTTVKPPLEATVRGTAHAYVHAGGSMIIVLYLNGNDLPGASPVILHARASRTALIVDVPRLVYGKSKKLGFPGVTATIVSLRLSVAPRGSGSHALLRAGGCDRGRFPVTTQFTYFDHTHLAVHSESKCLR